MMRGPKRKPTPGSEPAATDVPELPERIRGEPEERELTLARAKIGELMMRLELAEDLIEKRGFTDEWKRRAR
jgi:hypothetical protein